jgi:hypothetical protein
VKTSGTYEREGTNVNYRHSAKVWLQLAAGKSENRVRTLAGSRGAVAQDLPRHMARQGSLHIVRRKDDGQMTGISLQTSVM